MTVPPFGAPPSDLSQGPLTDDELDLLESLFTERRQLLDKIYEAEGEAALEGRDPGLVSVPELDGFLTALVSGPELVLPSVWLPAVLGDFEDALVAKPAQAMGLIMRHSNAISTCLMEFPEDFEPLVHEVTMEGDETALWLTPWCDGYLRAMALSADAWEGADDLIADSLVPIAKLSSLFEDEEAVDLLDQGEALPTLTQAARQIHRILLQERTHLAPTASAEAFRDDAPTVGRNAPCPCGSGRKYKHCCLH